MKPETQVEIPMLPVAHYTKMIVIVLLSCVAISNSKELYSCKNYLNSANSKNGHPFDRFFCERGCCGDSDRQYCCGPLESCRVMGVWQYCPLGHYCCGGNCCEYVECGEWVANPGSYIRNYRVSKKCLQGQVCCEEITLNEHCCDRPDLDRAHLLAIEATSDVVKRLSTGEVHIIIGVGVGLLITILLGVVSCCICCTCCPCYQCACCSSPEAPVVMPMAVQQPAVAVQQPAMIGMQQQLY